MTPARLQIVTYPPHTIRFYPIHSPVNRILIHFRSTLILCGLLCVPLLRAQYLVIDDFTNVLDLQVSPATPLATVSQSPLPGVLGGQRTASLIHDSVSLPQNRRAELGIGFGYFAYSNGSGVMSHVRLAYGDVSPLNVNLGPTGAFVLNDWTLDQGTMRAIVTLTSGLVIRSAELQLAASTVGVDYLFDFMLFPNIDFGKIDKVSLELITGEGSQDALLGLGGFSILPEPETYAATFALLSFAIAAWLRRSARVAKSA